MAVLLTPPPIRDPSDTQRWNDWYIRIADILDSINLGDIDVVDTTFRIEDDADETKRAMFECSGITTATTRTFTFPDTDGTLTLNAASQTLTNKTIDANNNTLSNVDAETLDTLDSTQFVRSDTTDVIQNEMRLVYSDPWMYTQFGNASGDTDSRWRVSQYSTSTTPVDQAEFYIDDLTISGALTFTAGDIGSGVADGASAIAFLLNSDNAFSTSGAKLLSLANALIEKFYVDKDGGFVAAAASQIQGNLDMNNNAITSIDWANSDDGSGSSLDADLLDGSQGAAYALLADNEIVTGTWTFNNTISGSIDGDAGTVDGYEGAELAVLAENETVSGAWTFSSTSGLTLNSSAPLIRFDESDQAADNQVWYFRPVAGQLRLEAVNDAETVATAAITIDRTGTTVDAIDFNADLDMNNNALLQIDWANSDDGAGSSLDADLLDGAEGSSYLRSDQDDSTSGALSIKGLTITEYSGDADITGLINGSTFGTLFEGDANAHVVIGIRGNDSNDGFHVIKDDTNDGTYDTILLECDTNVFEYKGNTVWTAASDGAGSGLNADTVDGYEGAELGVLAESETVTGTWQFQSVTNMYQSGGAAKDYLHLRDTTDTIDLVVRYDGANWEFRTESGGAGVQSMEITSGGDVRLTNVDWANSDDGSGSSLDADLLDGSEGSAYAKLADNETITGQWTFTDDGNAITLSATSPQIYFQDTTAGADDFWIHVNDNNFYVLADRGDDGSWESPHPLRLEADTNTAYTFGNRILTTADEGSGNGLDADLLDGVEGASYLRSDAADAYTSVLTGSKAHSAAAFTQHHKFNDSTSGDDFCYVYGFDSVSNQVKTLISSGVAAMQLHGGDLGSGQAVYTNLGASTDETCYITSDGGITFYTDLQAGWASRESWSFSNAGVTTLAGGTLNVNGGAITNIDWANSDDGSGSGLDADTVDGEHASAFQDQDAFLDDIAALTDPNDDRILFWDDSAAAITWLDLGDGLSLSGTTLSVDNIPATTKALFVQTAAPTGWTKDTTHNDKALRVVSGTASSGGATAFTSVFGSSKTTGAHTLTSSEMPSHTHNVAVANNDSGSGVSVIYTVAGSNGVHIENVAAADDETVATSSTGGGGSHDHTLSLDLHYVDVIIATKD